MNSKQIKIENKKMDNAINKFKCEFFNVIIRYEILESLKNDYTHN